LAAGPGRWLRLVTGRLAVIGTGSIDTAVAGGGRPLTASSEKRSPATPRVVGGQNRSSNDDGGGSCRMTEVKPRDRGSGGSEDMPGGSDDESPLWL